MLPNSENTIVGQIKEGLEEYEHDKRYKRLPRVTLLGMSVGMEAIKHSKLPKLSDKKVGLFWVFQ